MIPRKLPAKFFNVRSRLERRRVSLRQRVDLFAGAGHFPSPLLAFRASTSGSDFNIFV